jgi:hypothetical protein
MPQQNEGHLISLVADAAIAKYLRLKHSGTAGKVSIAGDEACIGTAAVRSYADGDPMVVDDIRRPGTRIFVAGGAIAIGDSVTSAAGGKVVTGTGGVEDYGKAITASTADGGLIECTMI